MRHADIRARASEYVDQELAPDQRAAFERHLRGCEPWRRFVRSCGGWWALLGAVGEEDRRG